MTGESTDTPRPLRVGANVLPARVERLSVYVHIPFCASRCPYCDFYFETGWSPNVLRRTLDRIVREAAFFHEAMGRPQIETIYFGGGTPSVIPPHVLRTFLGELRSLYFESGGSPSEFTFEANPESVGDELLDALCEGGVTRLSLGVQSLEGPVLGYLGRRADQEISLRALALIRRRIEGGSLRHFNIDLMTGVPGQNADDVRRDIEGALQFRPDHFSVYSLTIEERTQLGQAVARGRTAVQTRDEHEETWLGAKEYLEGAGFRHYEISNFARPGAESRHNQVYWRLEPYVGLGPSGVSTIPATIDNGGCPAPNASSPVAVRLKNPNLFLYGAGAGNVWQHTVETLSPRDLLLDHLLAGLRTAEGISLVRIERIFGIRLDVALAETFGRWVDDGAIVGEALLGDDAYLVFTPGKRLMLDGYLIELAALIDKIDLPSEALWPRRR